MTNKIKQINILSEDRLFDGDFANTALGRKNRREHILVDCDYCDGTGIDVFYKVAKCPFCYGSLVRFKKVDKK